MRLFLTGTTGFVGLNLLLEALKDARFDEIITAVRDPEKLTRQLAVEGVDHSERLRIVSWQDGARVDVDCAVHCAGVLFARDRESYFRVNVDDTLRLLAPIRNGARILVLSTQSAGGPTPPGKLSRSIADEDRPISWYGESKLEMERRLRVLRPDVQIWRLPMILGPRDRATLPLFKMASGFVRTKPGLQVKTYSWIAVRDLVWAILAALKAETWPDTHANVLAACSPGTITDIELIETAAAVMGRRGVTISLPHGLVRAVAGIVDTVPGFRDAVPSLTRDRAREIFPDRWVLDGTEFLARFGHHDFATLRDTLAETRAWYLARQLLPAA